MLPLGESRAAAWRMANVDLRNLRYDSGGITMSGRMDVI